MFDKHQYLAFDVSLPPPNYLSCSPKQLDSGINIHELRIANCFILTLCIANLRIANCVLRVNTPHVNTHKYVYVLLCTRWVCVCVCARGKVHTIRVSQHKTWLSHSMAVVKLQKRDCFPALNAVVFMWRSNIRVVMMYVWVWMCVCVKCVYKRMQVCIRQCESTIQLECRIRMLQFLPVGIYRSIWTQLRMDYIDGLSNTRDACVNTH